MTDKPLVSILTTIYNREKELPDAIESALESTYSNFELILVDDCSKDRSVEIARDYAAKDKRISIFVNETNLGDYANRNKAASLAKGKYIKFLDADDMMYYYGLEVMVNFTEKFPEAGFGLGCYPADHTRFPFMISPREIYLESFGPTNHFDRAPGSGLIKREVFHSLGGFSGKRMIGDYEFWFKIARYYSMVKLPLDLYWNRIHEGQESKSNYAMHHYDRLRKEVLEENLNHPDCPLSKDEILIVRKKMKQQRMKNNLLGILSKTRRVFVK